MLVAFAMLAVVLHQTIQINIQLYTDLESAYSPADPVRWYDAFAFKVIISLLKSHIDGTQRNIFFYALRLFYITKR